MKEVINSGVLVANNKNCDRFQFVDTVIDIIL